MVRADTIVVAGPIFTHGFQLVLDAKKVVFRSEGGIFGFNSVPPAQSAIPGQAPIGASGGPTPLRVNTYRVDDGRPTTLGSDGDPGKPGQPGLAGASGVPGAGEPSPVYFFAGEIIGMPKIMLAGQLGGKGGRGGQGGQGGTGGKGGTAIPVIFVSAAPLFSLGECHSDIKTRCRRRRR